MRILLCHIALVLGSTLSAQDSLWKARDTMAMRSMADITIVASRVRESILRLPVTVEKADRRYFAGSSSPSFFDALEHLKGVQMITPSIGFRILNTRGFANTTNVRFAQLVDGFDVQSPHISSPMGNALGPSDLDIDKVEILPGVASALYGMNTVNGLADFTTKNPFETPGVSLLQKTGVLNLASSSVSAKLYSETSLRWAQVFNSKWAFKVNANVSQGRDWVANNLTDLNPNANASTNLLGEDNPGADPANSYGNESSNRRTLNMGGKSYVVARTGYRELDITNYPIRNYRVDGGLFYRNGKGLTMGYIFRLASLDNVYQRSNRFELRNYFIQQQGIRLEHKWLQAKVYYNGEQTGSSFNMRSMAENMDRTFKTDNRWFADYSAKFNGEIGTGKPIVEAHRQARITADAGRFQPGTEAFDSLRARLQQINNWDSGAALKVRAHFIHLEAHMNLTDEWLSDLRRKTGLELLVGFDHRTYFIFPDGNYFRNPEPGKEGQYIRYGKTGVFLSMSRNFFTDKLRLGFILRADKNDYFKTFFSPRATAVYTASYRHHFRSSYQIGYRYPIIFEAYTNVNSGGVKRVGGLPVMSSGIFENSWLESSINAFRSAVLADVNSNGLSRNEAIEKNKDLLKRNPYTYIQPEKVNAFDIGYRGLFLKNRLYLDAELYVNRYQSFIAQANMNIPRISLVDSIPFYLNDISKQDRYRMWTNSSSVLTQFGFSLGLQYSLGKGYLLNTNTSFARLINREEQDGLEDGFNTPSWMANLSVSNTDILPRIGAGMTVHWQSSFNWQSFLMSGMVPAYWTLDAHLSYRFPGNLLSIKAGGTNVLNRYYFSFLGGPRIGGFYYLTLILSSSGKPQKKAP
jgi:outer membrane receptor protein involved in Fe transport